MGYFNYERIAEGYAKDRPFYHFQVMEMLKEEISMKGKLEQGLDVGCGAGASALALQKICRKVVAVDESEEMIRSAKIHCKDSGIHFVKCRAEELKFPADTYDIITAAGSVNWIDEQIFLQHAGRMLKSGGILLVYDNPMVDQMKGVPEFTHWWNHDYLQHFPKPPRKETVWDECFMDGYGFSIVNQVNWRNFVTMTQEEFVQYILTQTNVIARVEQQGADLAQTREWFAKSVEHMFGGEKRTLVCEGYNWYFRKR